MGKVEIGENSVNDETNCGHPGNDEVDGKAKNEELEKAKKAERVKKAKHFIKSVKNLIFHLAGPAVTLEWERYEPASDSSVSAKTSKVR